MKKIEEADEFILHIFPREKFTDQYITFINSEFKKSNHKFFIYGNIYKTNIDNEINVISYKCSIEKICYFINLLYKSKGIVLHSFTNSKIITLLFLQPWLLKKLNISFWGSDLYYYREKKVTIKKKVFEFIRSTVIRNAKFITTLVDEDYKMAKKWYKVKGDYLEGKYMDIKSQKNLFELRNKIKRGNNYSKTINIQIGNNAQETNNHMKAIDLVSKFVNYDIKVFVPLSYSGKSEYIEKVLDYGKRKLGDKFIPLLDYIPIEKYNEYLTSIDIAIFCNNRQQGMGNINSLIYLGSKVFIDSNTSMWNHFKNKLNYKIYKVEDIKYMDFAQFIKRDDDDIENNYIKVEKYRSKEYSIMIWKDIFTSMNLS